MPLQRGRLVQDRCTLPPLLGEFSKAEEGAGSPAPLQGGDVEEVVVVAGCASVDAPRGIRGEAVSHLRVGQGVRRGGREEFAGGFMIARVEFVSEGG